MAWYMGKEYHCPTCGAVDIQVIDQSWGAVFKCSCGWSAAPGAVEAIKTAQGPTPHSKIRREWGGEGGWRTPQEDKHSSWERFEEEQ